MARVKVEIDKDELIAAIDKVEANGPLKNRSVLHARVAATEWAKNHQPKPVTSSVVGLRIEEFGIEPKTPKGRRTSGGGAPTRRLSKKEKFENPEAQKVFDNLAATAPTSLQKTIERARGGSMAAIVKMKCVECAGFEDARETVRTCATKTCPIWPIRPYQQITVNGDDSDDDTD